MEEVDNLVIDPVCGEELDAAECEYKSNYQGKTYHFCCLNCQLDFEEAPQRFVSFYA